MNLDILQGRAELFTIGPLTAFTGAMEDLANKKVLFVVKDTDDQPDAEAKLVYGIVVDAGGTPTTEAGLVFGRYINGVLQDTTPTSGYLTLEFNDDDTRTWEPGEYPYELGIVGGSRPYTLRTGFVVVTDTLIDNPETLLP